MHIKSSTSLHTASCKISKFHLIMQITHIVCKVQLLHMTREPAHAFHFYLTRERIFRDSHTLNSTHTAISNDKRILTFTYGESIIFIAVKIIEQMMMVIIVRRGVMPMAINL